MIKVILFDFGGVIAEEGFYNGLRSIASDNGLDPAAFFRVAEELIHATGYVTGKASEKDYWDAVRNKTGIMRDNTYLREQILVRFVLRPALLAYADSLRAAGRGVSILSDQTGWLDELNDRSPFFSHFDRVFNSYHLGKSKRDASLFRDVCRELHIAPGEAVLVDDNPGNVDRALSQGLRAVLYTNIDTVKGELDLFTTAS